MPCSPVEVDAPGWRWPLVAGVLAFLIGLVAWAPASLLDPWLRQSTQGRVYLARSAGTVWDGQGELAVAAGSAPGTPVAWRLQFLPLFSGRLGLELRLGSEQWAEVQVGPAFLGVSQMRANLPGALVAEFGDLLAKLKLGGRVQIECIALQATPASVVGQARLLWAGAASSLSPFNPVGDYQLELNGSGPVASLRLSTLAGQLLVNGNGQWRPGERLSFEGLARPAEEKIAVMRPFLSLLGPMTRGDEVPIRFEVGLR